MAMTTGEFRSICRSWVPGGAYDLHALLTWALAHIKVTRNEVAAECEVSPSTISRWASGETTPRPSVQSFIIERLRERVE